jgi:hypothetical protein
MGKPGLASVIGHALIDKKFRDLMLVDPKKAADQINAHVDDKEIDFLKEGKVKEKIKACSDEIDAQYEGYGKGAH